MENALFGYISSSTKCVYAAMNFTMASKSIISIYMPYFKLGSMMMTGMYFYSDMTSFFYKVRSQMPSKVALMNAYNQQYLGISNQLKLLSLAQKYFKGQEYSVRATKSTLNLNQELGESMENTSDLANTMNMSAFKIANSFDDSAVIELSPNYAELRALRKQVSQDIQTSAISGVEQAGQKYLDLIFRDNRVHRASLDLINKAIRQETFLKESRDYGIDLINEVIKDPNFQKVIKRTSIDIVQHDDIKSRSIDIIQHIVTHPTTHSNVTRLMNQVFTETYAKDALIDVLTESTIEAVTDAETITNMGELFNKIGADKGVQQAATKSLVHTNLFNLVTLNIPSTVVNFSSKTMDLIQ